MAVVPLWSLRSRRVLRASTPTCTLRMPAARIQDSSSAGVVARSSAKSDRSRGRPASPRRISAVSVFGRTLSTTATDSVR